MNRVGRKIDETNLKSMNAKFYFLFFLTASLLFHKGWAAPQRLQSTPYTSFSDAENALKQMKNQMYHLSHSVENHETEIESLTKKIQLQEEMLDASKEETHKDIDGIRKIVSLHTTDLESNKLSIASADNLSKGIIADLKQIKIQSNDLVDALKQANEKITQLEKALQAQNVHMQKIEIALQSLGEFMTTGTEAKIYKVQPGDSLGKIAIEQKVSLKTLRELNQLKNDKIFPGQTLKLS